MSLFQKYKLLSNIWAAVPLFLPSFSDQAESVSFVCDAVKSIALRRGQFCEVQLGLDLSV